MRTSSSATELSPSTLRARAQVRQATALVSAAIATAPPDEVDVAAAAEMAASLGHLAKLVSSAMLRYARHTGADAAGVLAGVAGTARGAARRQLQAAERVESVPQLEQAYATGALSLDQASLIAPAAAAAPSRAGELIEAAQRTSFRELRAQAERVERAARSEQHQVEAERRVHARRFCNVWTAATGGVRLEALLPRVEGATVMSALEKEADALWEEAARAGSGSAERRERLVADALVALVSGNARTSGAHLLVSVDAAALVRGAVHDGETCEVRGVGPVSVEAARSLMGEGFFTLLVEDGEDISTVTSTTRVIPRKVRMALIQRDPTCVVPGCPATRNLEIDHWRTDFARFGPTELDNLCRLCALHHRMKTKEGWRLGGGPGRWRWLPPRTGRRPSATAQPPRPSAPPQADPAKPATDRRRPSAQRAGP